MPDASKLVAAICIASLALVTSLILMSIMPDHTKFGYFTQINVVVGLFVGWRMMGTRAGRGVTAAINNGFAGAFMLVLLALFLHSCVRMFDRAMHNWYSGVLDAFAAVLHNMADFGLVLLDPQVLLTLAAGGMIAGLATEFAWRAWR